MGPLGLRSAVSVAHAGHTSVHTLSWRAYGPHLDTRMHVPRPVGASAVFTGEQTRKNNSEKSIDTSLYQSPCLLYVVATSSDILHSLRLPGSNFLGYPHLTAPSPET